MDFSSVGILVILLHAVTVVGIMEWVKKLERPDTQSLAVGPHAVKRTKRRYTLFLPVAAIVVAVSTLWAPAQLALRLLAWSQLAYPFLVKLPEKILSRD